MFTFIGRPYCALNRGRQRHLIAARSSEEIWAAIGRLPTRKGEKTEWQPPLREDGHWMAALLINAPSVDKLLGPVFYHESGAGDVNGLAMGDEAVPMQLLDGKGVRRLRLVQGNFADGCALAEMSKREAA